MRIIKTLFIFLLIVSSCSKSETITIHDVISGVDKTLLRTKCFSRYLSDTEIAFLKDTIGGGSYVILNEIKINPRYFITLYQGDSIIGFVGVDSISGNRLKYTNIEYDVSVEIDYNLGKYLNSITDINNIDCKNSYKRVLHDTLTVREFLNILPVNNPIPNVTYFMSVWSNVNSNWITKDDIYYMIDLIDRTDTTYCIGSSFSSVAFRGEGDYSTLGGHVINLIDFYRLNKTSLIFHPRCFKNDSIRKKEILEWWEKKVEE